MEQRESNLIPVSGSAWHGVRYGCTTRYGGVSTGQWSSLNLGLRSGDDEQAVRENRRLLAAILPGEPFWLRQVHGTRVVEVGSDAPQDLSAQTEFAARAEPEADAAITLERGRVLTILTADCAPVVIADTQGRAVAAAHAGWRGLAAGVLEASLQALRARLSGDATWRAWVGPCIGQASFEVGEEVREAFVEQDAVAAQYFAAGVRPGKWQADLAGLARHRLLAAGVQHVEIAGLCTYERDDVFFSYRRVQRSGRMATLAWLE